MVESTNISNPSIPRLLVLRKPSKRVKSNNDKMYIVHICTCNRRQCGIGIRANPTLPCTSVQIAVLNTWVDRGYVVIQVSICEKFHPHQHFLSFITNEIKHCGWVPSSTFSLQTHLTKSETLTTCRRSCASPTAQEDEDGCSSAPLRAWGSPSSGTAPDTPNTITRMQLIT